MWWRLSPRIVLLGASAVIGFAIACSGADDAALRDKDLTPAPEAWIPAPIGEAYCQINVTGTGWVDTETDYLPHVITCENGGANLEALKAQAIAARSVAYYSMANSGSICDGQGCQVYSCGAEPSAKAYQAVEETSGIYLNYEGVLTYAFYVAGDANTDPPSCVGTPGVGTENWVTYNEGQSGANVEQTALGWIFDVGEPGYGQNRGCMSQWGARCLENSNGYGYADILRFYYGADIEMTQAQGSCIVDPGGDSTTTTSSTTGDPTTTSTSSSDGNTSWGTDTSSDAGGSDDNTCTIGSLGCVCTMGGGCDPGLLCVDGYCIPEAAAETGASSAGEGVGSEDEVGSEEGLPADYGADGSIDASCACTSSEPATPREGLLSLALLGLLGLVRRRSA